MFQWLRKTFRTSRVEPLKPPEIVRGPSALYVIGTSDRPDDRDPVYQFQRFDFDEREWTVISQTTPKARSAFAVATYQDSLWVIGGKDSNSRITNTVFVYNPKASYNKRWRRGTPMNLSRHGLCATVLEGKLYVVGGTDADGATDRVEVWNGDSWEFRQSMHVKRTDFTIGVIRYRMYALGGNWARQTISFTLECYTPTDDKWTVVGIPCPHSLRSGAGVAGCVLYSAGKTRFSCLRRGMFGDHSWSSGPRLPFKVEGFGVIADRTNLYIVGGVPDTDEDTETTFWKFITTENWWYRMPAPPSSPRYDVKVALI